MHTLYVVATPIGNLEDITIRAIKILLQVPVIACEDTRRTGLLIDLIKKRYLGGVCGKSCLGQDMRPVTSQKKFISIRDWNESEATDNIITILGKHDVALVSDAGTPLISDPGFKLVRKAKQKGIAVVPIPGANAAIAALSASGLPTNKFLFWGFPKKGAVSVQDAIPKGVTHIFYESPKRTQKTITSILSHYPNAQIVVAREITKIHENIEAYKNDGSPDRIIEKGEVTILVYIPDS